MATQRLSIGVIGPGLVGAALLDQLLSHAGALRGSLGIEMCVTAVANSRAMLLGTPLDLRTWKADLAARGVPLDLAVAEQWVGGEQGVPLDLAAFTQHLGAARLPCAVVDCTASAAVPAMYARWLGQGIHVVTPNKRLGSGPACEYQAAMQAARSGGGMFFSEATVGAGLPVLSTLGTLLATGDRVERIEGVLSGTLSYLFNSFAPGQRFSALVADARAAGFTEPDPRDDLSGMDVARKAVILARQCGLDLELSDVSLESLVPAALRNARSADEFLARLPEFDGDFEARAAGAAASGRMLRYVAAIDIAAGACSVGLQAVPREHAFAQLSASDNVVAFTTGRYQAQPLVVRGPGAGAAVTAAGVFGDLVQLARCLGPARAPSPAIPG